MFVRVWLQMHHYVPQASELLNELVLNNVPNAMTFFHTQVGIDLDVNVYKVFKARLPYPQFFDGTNAGHVGSLLADALDKF